MNILIKLIVVCILWFSVFSLEADNANKKTEPTMVRFRYGWVLSAELGTKPVPIKNVSMYAPKIKIPKDKRAYAILYVKLDKGRSVGVYDFALVKGKKGYSCRGIAEGDNDFDANNWQFEKTSPDKIYKMLFIIPMDKKISDKTIEMPEYNLYYRFLRAFHAKAYYTPIKFHFIGKSDFSSVALIPANGDLGIKKEETVSIDADISTDSPLKSDTSKNKTNK